MSAAPLLRNSQADHSFGPRLRRERERRKIALASIAENSKISVALFEDLERDDVSRWPSGIFRRSFIRAYAQAVGLDSDDITREFLERFPDPNDPAAAPLTASPAPPSAAAQTPGVTGAGPVAKSTGAGPVTRRTAPGGRALSASERCMAVAWDAGIVITLGLLLYTTFGSLWMPLCVAMTVYFAGGIILFGNTPGASLCAPSTPAIRLRRSSPPPSGDSSGTSVTAIG